MTTPLWCLATLAIIPYALAAMGGYYRVKQFGSVDNNYPRIQSTKLEGRGARVWAAQSNAWEALGFFTAVIVVAHFAGADAAKVATASLVFVSARILHPVLYISDMATLRSIIQVVGIATCVYIFYLAVTA